MNLLDILLIAVGVGAAVGGYRLGFVRRVTGWVGMIAGIVAASALLPVLLGRVDQGADLTSEAPRRLVVASVAICVGAIAGQALGSVAGARLARVVERRNLGRPDAALGAVAGVLGVVLTLWLVLPTMAQVPGWPSRQARSSAIARTVDGSLGAPPGLLDNLGRAVGVDGLPRVFENLELSPEVDAPPEGVPVSDEVLAAGQASTVKVVGPACGETQTGSGWVVDDGLIVTNAHVVAGTESLRVEDAVGRRFGAEVVALDTLHDLAIVAAPSFRGPPLDRGDAEDDSVGVVLGFPGGGPLTISNYRVDRRMSAIGRDIYDQRSVQRDMYVIGAELRPGNSGGPMIDVDGRAVGVVFAIAPDQDAVAYAITNDQVEVLLDQVDGDPVPTGACTA